MFAQTCVVSNRAIDTIRFTLFFYFEGEVSYLMNFDKVLKIHQEMAALGQVLTGFMPLKSQWNEIDSKYVSLNEIVSSTYIQLLFQDTTA